MIVGRQEVLAAIALCGLWGWIGTQVVVAQGVGLPSLLTPELVPESEIPARVKGLLPMRRDEFDRLLRQRSLESGGRGPGQIEIERAVYFARFAAGQLVDGRAAWLLTPRSESIDGARMPPHSLPLERRANFGPNAADLAPGASALSRSSVFDSGRSVEFGWSLSPIRRRAGQDEFAFTLPASSVSQLLVETPLDWVLKSFTGVVRQFELESADVTLQRIASASTSGGAGTQLWLIELGGQTSSSFTLTGPSPSQRAPRLRHSFRYLLHEGGIEVQARLLLDFPVRYSEFVLEVDGSLRISSVKMGEVALDVQEPAVTGAVTVRAPNGSFSGPREIEVSAIGPIELGTLFRLPGIRVADSSWQQGDLSLEVPRSLELRKLEAKGYLEANMSRTVQPLGGESREFTSFEDDGELFVHVQHRPVKVSVQTAASCRLAKEVVTIQQVSSVRSDRGQQFDLNLVSPKGWIVDSLETIPASALESLVTTGTEDKFHKLSLRQPVNGESPIQIAVQSHRLITSGRLESSELRSTYFAGVDSENRYVTLSADRASQLRLFEDEGMARVQVNELPDEVRGLIEWPAGGVAYEDDPLRSSFWLQVLEQSPRYAARIEVEAIVDGSSLFQSFAVHCEPRDSAVSTLVVELTRASESDIDWSVDNDPDAIVSVRQLPQVLERTGALVEISLRSALVESFTLRGMCQEPFTPATRVALASTPDAESQTGTIMLATADGGTLSVPGTGLQATFGPESSGKPLPAVRSYFRYDPTAAASISIAKLGRDGQPSPVWVWQCQLNSWFDQSGLAVHHGRLDVENLGARQTTIKFPVEVRIERVAVNGEELPLTSSILQRNSIDIPLPRRRRSCSIQIEYGSEVPRLGVVSTVETPWPILSIPCLQRSWRVWLPPGYRATKLPNLQAGVQGSWDQRLLGAASRRDMLGQLAFRSGSDWRKLLGYRPTFGGQSHGVLFDDFQQAALLSVPDYPPTAAMGDQWASYVIDLAGGQPARLSIVRRSVERSFGWILALLTAAILVWAFPDRRRWLPYVIVAAAGATLLVPNDAVVLVRGVFHGSIVASLYLIIGRRPRPPLVATSHVVARLTLFLLTCSFATTGTVRAQEMSGLSSVPPLPASNTNRVVIPIDDAYQPIGEALYVAPELYDLLHGGLAGGQAAGVTIESARYRATLGRSSQQSGLEQATLIATFQVQAARRGSRLALPFKPDQMIRVDATLDGQRVNVTWRRDHLEIELLSSGRSRLEITMRVVAERGRKAIQMRLDIPVVADSKLTLRAPRQTRGLVIAKCLGAQTVSDSNADVHEAHLGPTDQIDIRWARDQRRRLPEFTAETMTWLRIRPTATVVEIACRLSVTSGELTTLSLVAGEQLIPQLIEVDGASATYFVDEKSGQAFDVELPSPYLAGEEGVVRASFLIPTFNGIGRLPIPEVNPAMAASNSTWLAVSHPDDLTVVVEPAAGTNRASELDFAATWPAHAEEPRLAFRLSKAEGPFTLEVRPVASAANYQIETALSVGRQFAQVHTRAAVMVLRGYLLQQRIELPDGLRVEAVSVQQSNRDRLLRWAIEDGQGEAPAAMTVFFNEPLTGAFSMDLVGAQPVALDEPLPSVRVRFGDSNRTQRALHFYRRSDIRFGSGVGLHQTTEPDWFDTARAGRYAGSLSGEDLAGSESIVVHRNLPQATASLSTELTYRNESWHAQIDIDVQANGGMIDQLRLRVPSEWSISGHDLHDVPGMSGKVLAVRPPEAISSTYQVQLRAEPTNPQDQDFRVPDISLLDIPDVERFVVLPSRTNDQALVWHLRGLKPLSTSATGKKYQVVERSMQAHLIKTQRVTGMPIVHLADYYISWKDDGSCRGVASFDVDPVGQAFCRLVLPEGSTLVQVTVSNLPATMALEGTRRWRIRLGSDQLPQRVVVLFAGQLARRRSPLGGQMLHGPWLADLPVKRTLWTVETTRAEGRWRPLLGHTEVDFETQARSRLETVSQLLQRSRSDVGAPNEYDAWRENWLQREQDYRAQLGRLEPLAVSNRSADAQSIQPSLPDNLVDKWLSRLEHGRFLHCEMLGDAEMLIVKRPGWVVQRMAVSASILAAMFGFGLLAWVYFRSPFCREWLVRWPHAIGVSAGVLLLLLVVPSSVGCLLVVLFTFSSLRPIWLRIPAK